MRDLGTIRQQEAVELESNIILSPDGEEVHVIDFELRHVVYTLAGVVVAGVIIVVVYQWASHAFRKRRAAEMAGLVTSGLHGVASLARETRLLLNEIEFEDEKEVSA
jgi:hypothetical protein